MRFLRREVRGRGGDFRVRVGGGELPHNRRRPFAVAKILHLLDDARRVPAGETGYAAMTAAVGAVAVGAIGGNVPAEVRIGAAGAADAKDQSQARERG